MVVQLSFLVRFLWSYQRSFKPTVMKAKTSLTQIGLSLSVFIISLVWSNQAQSQDLKTLLEQFRNYQETAIQEKVFIHLDKTQYAASETVWAKAYLVAGPMHLPSGISKNLYLELLDESGEVRQRLILETTDGLAQASFPLEKNLTTGDYYIRAYTHWMKNFGQDLFFNKKIRVVNVEQEEAVVAEAETPRNPLSLRFYPEGGHLVKNIASKMAFELTETPGEFKEYKGTIYNRQDQAVAKFTTSHENRGMLKFTPKSDGYYARVEGYEQEFQLPLVKPVGMVMLVNNKKEKEILVTVKASDDMADDYYVVAHTRGYITYASQISLRGKRGLARIQKSTLPAGISHITLMSADLAPLAERLVFVPETKGSTLKVKTDRSGYDTRDLVTVDLEVKDERGRPVQGSFSLSAYKHRFTVNDQTNHHIKAHMLLGSDLKGHVHNPGQYFVGSTRASRNLDLLMMVNGWSRFSWDDLKTGEFNAAYLPEKGLDISGRLVKTGKEKIKKGSLFIYNKDTGQPILASLEEDGRFIFENVNYRDTTQIIFQGTQKNGFKNVTLQLDTAYEQLPLRIIPTKPIKLSPIMQQEFVEQFRSFVTVKNKFNQENGYMDLGEVTVTAQREGLRDGRLTGVMTVTDFSDIPLEEKSRKHPFQLMMGRVPGLTWGPTTLDGNIQDMYGRTPVMGASYDAFKNTPAILLNGVPVPPQDIWDLDPHKIDYVLTSREFSGMISVYTKTAEEYGRTKPKAGLYVANLPGYHTPEDFYAPRYDGSTNFSNQPDNRITLFWEPMITTNARGKARITFYTSDQEGPVVIDVQGISSKGKTAVGNTSFTIRTNM